jgi:ABC-2 type transport system ATP-binding protein
MMRFPQQQGWKAVLKHKPGKVALDSVSLAVNQGDIFGLLGPNGAGKTTLVKVLCTLTIPTEGTAKVLGLDVTRNGLEVRRRLGVVYGDERTFFWRLSGLENLIFYASLHGFSIRDGRRRAYEVLDLVGLAEAADVRMHHYSSGMRQRTSIARGLLNHPDLLVMDEPTRSLDPIAAQEIRRLVKERVANERRTVLIATNIMAEAEFLCDRLAFLNHGRVEMTGSIDEMRNLLESEDIYEIVVSGFPGMCIDDLRRLHGVASAMIMDAEGDRQMIRITVRRGVPMVPDAIRIIVQTGADVWSCGRRELSVDEMFAALAQRAPLRVQQESVPA